MREELDGISKNREDLKKKELIIEYIIKWKKKIIKWCVS